MGVMDTIVAEGAAVGSTEAAGAEDPDVGVTGGIGADGADIGVAVATCAAAELFGIAREPPHDAATIATAMKPMVAILRWGSRAWSITASETPS